MSEEDEVITSIVDEIMRSDAFLQFMDSFQRELNASNADMDAIYNEIMEESINELISNEEVREMTRRPIEIREIITFDCIYYNEEVNGKDADCSICLLGFDDNEYIVQLECKHLFHRRCITEWCERKLECPNCRTPVDSYEAPVLMP